MCVQNHLVLVNIIGKVHGANKGNIMIDKFLRVHVTVSLFHLLMFLYVLVCVLCHLVQNN